MAAVASAIWNHHAAAGKALTAATATPMSGPASGTGGTGGTSGSGSSDSSTSSSATISANDTPTLLVTEMQNQDPTANTDPNEYINQLVQVNSLEQLIDINQNLTTALGGSSTTASSSATSATTPAAALLRPQASPATAPAEPLPMSRQARPRPEPCGIQSFASSMYATRLDGCRRRRQGSWQPQHSTGQTGGAPRGPRFERQAFFALIFQRPSRALKLSFSSRP